MKRYLVFYGKDYYPSGGMDDLLGHFDTIEECKKAIEDRVLLHFKPDRTTLEEHIRLELRDNWNQVYDTQTMQEVKV